MTSQRDIGGNGIPSDVADFKVPTTETEPSDLNQLLINKIMESEKFQNVLRAKITPHELDGFFQAQGLGIGTEDEIIDYASRIMSEKFLRKNYEFSIEQLKNNPDEAIDTIVTMLEEFFHSEGNRERKIKEARSGMYKKSID